MVLAVRIAAASLVAFIVAAPCNAQTCGRRGACAVYDPQPTTIPKPDTSWLASPSFDGRNYLTEIDSIVIHTTEGSLSGKLDIFQHRENVVSAHYVIAPNGDIYQMVDTKHRGWHATYYNYRSIGIEMVVFAGQAETWNAQNLASLRKLVAYLIMKYPTIPASHPFVDAKTYPQCLFTEAGLGTESWSPFG